MNPKHLFLTAAFCIFFGENISAASDELLILGIVTECVKEYNLDRVESSPTPGAEAQFATEQGRLDFYLKRAVAENLALKHCQNARSMLNPMLKTADPELNKSIALLDSSFAIREKIHKQAIEMIDRVSSGRGHANVSEIGKAGADAIEGLNLFINSTTTIFSKLMPSLSSDERKLLAQKISALFPEDQKAYDNGPTKVHQAAEVMMIMAIRDQLLGR